MQTHPQQTARGIAWERSRMDRLVTQYQSAQPVPVRERPLDIDLVSRLWLCLRREGYGQAVEEPFAEE
ncbi:MAG TPA: hypothetical protein PKD53_12405 [Chloroflexaceae bacterium]|nr:hypothetical protein [Chloroflexaceae bacterium]